MLSIAKSRTFVGKRDVESGLDYRGARFYDSDIGRFLSLDPLAVDYANWSAYNYVLGNPVMLVDPTGMAPEGGPGIPAVVWWVVRKVIYEGGKHLLRKKPIRVREIFENVPIELVIEQNKIDHVTTIVLEHDVSVILNAKDNRQTPDDTYDEAAENKKLEKLKKQIEGKSKTGTSTKRNTKNQVDKRSVEGAAQQHEEIIKAHQNNSNAVEGTKKSKDNVRNANRRHINELNNENN